MPPAAACQVAKNHSATVFNDWWLIDDYLKMINGIRYTSLKEIFPQCIALLKGREKKKQDSLLALRCTLYRLSWRNYLFCPESLGATRFTVVRSRSYQSLTSFLYSPSPPHFLRFGKLPLGCWIFKVKVAICFDYANWQLLLQLLTLMNQWNSWWNMSTCSEQM